ncbi:GPI mannosyltransferase 4 [Bacillus rossius redtenbacheri]|uniref:GPI mannosyltransferase 4 n=1 Tax=Bacillus rossius redtenbacheri TaxID=93214 RepID=UPI002FDD3F27
MNFEWFKTFAKRWKSIQIGSLIHEDKIVGLVSFWILASLRIILTLLPQSGYIHPDEFFQSVEVVAGDVFDLEVSRPWEFNTTFPVRSAAVLYGVVGVPLALLKAVSPFAALWFGWELRTPYAVLATARLAACLLSFLVDLALYRACRACGRDHRALLVALASSFVVLVYGTRTFSNTIEMALQSVLIGCVADCMALSEQVIERREYLDEQHRKAGSPADRARVHKLRLLLPRHSLRRCAAVATLTVVGVFNRPTFLAFAVAPVFFWLQRGLGSASVGLLDFHLRMLALVLAGLPTLVLLILVDSFYYGYLTLGEISAVKLSLDNLVVTPLNFIKYNANADNLARHGLHPRYLHLLVNVPLLYNALGLVALGAALRLVYRCVCRRWRDLPRAQSVVGLMTASWLVPVALLSLFPHQEPRFLVPVTLPLVFLYTRRLHRHGGLALSCWYACNILLTAFFGFAHQGGVWPLAEHFSREMAAKPRLTAVHLVTSYVYPLPLFPLMLRNSRRPLFSRQTNQHYRLAREFHPYELGSGGLDRVLGRAESLITSCERTYAEKKLDYRVYVALPMSLAERFYGLVDRTNSSLSYATVKVFYPHVSTEALPSFPLAAKCRPEQSESDSCEEYFYSSPIKFFSRYAQQFGLALIKIQKVSRLM